jgi:type I pantothenate kinase
MSPELAAVFQSFARQRWAELRANEPMTLSRADVERLRGHQVPISLEEIEQVYLPICRLLSLYVEANRHVYRISNHFLQEDSPPVPFILGVCGSVAVGKSTTSRLLQALLSRWETHPRVALLTTDGFLYSNAQLQARGLLQRKGFPESYDRRALLQLLSDIKAGAPQVGAPVYSHEVYDIVPGATQIIERPDILIVEGVNVLQVKRTDPHSACMFVSDFFDFSIYVDASEETIKQWYIQRFKLFAEQARDKPKAFFYRFHDFNAGALETYATDVWDQVNAKNLQENILPFRPRARLILQKSANHQVRNVLLRRT